MASSANLTQQADEAGEDDYDSDEDAQGFKSSLNEWLDQVKTAGSFATAGQCLNFPLPGLSVEGSGMVGLPLTAITAKSVISVCHQAPFGKGTLQLWVDCSHHKLMAVQEAKLSSMSQYVRHGSSILPISHSRTRTGKPACKGLPVPRRASWAILRVLR